jgi:hypothetical protein
MITKNDCARVKGKWENTSCVYTLDTIRILEAFEKRSFLCPNVKAFQEEMMKSFGIVPVSVNMAWDKYIRPTKEMTPEYDKESWYALNPISQMRATHAYYQKQLDDRVGIMLSAVKTNIC